MPTPMAWARIRTSPGFGSGTGTSRHRSTSGGPGASNWMSFMDHAPSVDPTGSLSWAHSIPFLARYNPSPWNKIIEWNSRMTEISDVRAFVRVVERGGFAAASKDLGITASAVSKLIRRLEDRLGVRLLHRTTRRVAL